MEGGRFAVAATVARPIALLDADPMVPNRTISEVGVTVELGLAAAALIFIFVVALVRWRRAARWRTPLPIGLRHPVVMAHGVLGFSKMRWWGIEIEYFRGLWTHLDAAGVRATYPAVPRTATIQDRARVLASHVRSLKAPKVVIVAHSMGGLDARYAIRHLGLSDRVAAVVTVGTPHRGNMLSDSTRVFPRLVRWGLRRLGADGPAFDQFAPAALESFNRDVPDAADVRYFSVVASASWRSMLVNPALWPSYLYLRRGPGPNDGLVGAETQRWGEVLFEVDADHWAQMGWSLWFDARGLYTRILCRLAEMGY